MKQIKTFESDNLEEVESNINAWIKEHTEVDSQSIKIIPYHFDGVIESTYYLGEVIYNIELDKRSKHVHR